MSVPSSDVTPSPRAALGCSPGRSTPIDRRALLAVAAGGLLSLTGCGKVRLGAPEQYTPPPPGIDDLYRVDLIGVLDRAIAGVEKVILAAEGAPSTVPSAPATLMALRQALPLQRSAVLTGAEAEKERKAAEDPLPSDSATASPEPTDVPADEAALVTVLVELRSLTIDAARQVSGSLARPIAAIGAHTTWAVDRLATGSGGEAPPALPSPDEVVPSREVPSTDLPSIGAESDFHLSIEDTQRQLWYAGYVHEVLAAHAEDAQRTEHLARSELYRGRAETLGEIAEEHGAPVVTRQAVYALPGGTMDEQTAGQMPVQLSRSLLLAQLTLVGAAPFAARPLPIIASLEEAQFLASRTDRFEPLPSLEVDDTVRQEVEGGETAPSDGG